MKRLLSTLLFIVFTAACTSSETEPVLTGPYLGQQVPGNNLELFAPGIVSDGLHNRDITITPDGLEIYTTVNWGNNNFSKIVVHAVENGVWTEARTVPFSSGFRYQDIEPTLSADGTRIFFASNRPDAASGRKEKNWDIWAAERKNNSWGEPYNLGSPVNSETDEFFPSVTRDGTVYFTRLQEDTRENFIYRCRFENGEYLEAEKLEKNVNCGRGRYNAFVAPDESYIIVPVIGREDSLGGADYYIVFRDKDDQWSAPLNMGPEINSPTGQEWSASLSPDGEYLFFMKTLLNPEFEKLPVNLDEFRRIISSPENGEPDVYWISSSIIEKLRQAGIESGENKPGK
jgi:WD40-like Beta Propeller Repeat